MSIIKIKNASVRIFDAEILSDISWQVAKGEHWFILGANGAGKTTLVKMLMGFQWPLFGAEIEILNYRFGSANLVEMRKKIAWVSPFLSNWTSDDCRAVAVVLSGLDQTIGLHREAEDFETAQALEVMSKLNCAHLAEHKFDTLSSGEQIKMLICRALMGRPELIILDEPCVYLDLKSREFLLRTIEEFINAPEAPTVIFISQRIEDISPAFSKGMLLKDGRIIASGSHDLILTEQQLSAAFDMPLKLYRSSDGRFWPVPCY